MQPNRAQPPPSAASVFQQQGFGGAQGQPQQFHGGAYQSQGQPGQYQPAGGQQQQPLGQQNFSGSFANQPSAFSFGAAPSQSLPSGAMTQNPYGPAAVPQQQPSFANFSQPASSQPQSLSAQGSTAGFGVYGQPPQQQASSSFAFSPAASSSLFGTQAALGSPGGSFGGGSSMQSRPALGLTQPQQPSFGSFQSGPSQPQSQQPTFSATFNLAQLSQPQQSGSSQSQSSFSSFPSSPQQQQQYQQQPVGQQSFGSLQQQQQPSFGNLQQSGIGGSGQMQHQSSVGTLPQQPQQHLGGAQLQQQTSFNNLQRQPPLSSGAQQSSSCGAGLTGQQQPSFGNLQQQPQLSGGSQQQQTAPQQQGSFAPGLTSQQQPSFGNLQQQQPSFGGFQGAAAPQPPVSGGSSFNVFGKVPSSPASQPVAAVPVALAVVEDPRMMQAIRESTNPDVVALRQLLEADKEKSRLMLEQKKQVVDKWTGVCADLTGKKKLLQEKIADARAENVKLKEELSNVRATYKAEREALSLIAREEMRLEHAAALAMLHDSSQEGDKTARPENIASMSNLLSQALEKLRAAIASGEPVDPELMDVVRLLKSYLNFVRGIAYNASDQELAARLVEAAELAAAVQQFEAAFSDPSARNVDQLIQAVRNGMGKVEQVCKLLEEKEEKVEAMEDGKLQDAAEMQLREAAMRIEQAARQISAIRMAPRSQDFGMGALKVCDALLTATEDLALITGRLVMHATLAQKERKAQEANAGTGEEMREQYRQNQTWVNGLISAAQAAAYRISLLVQVANRVVQKQQSWEYIIAGSEEVQMAGVQLVTAARAKLDSFSLNNRNLQATQQELSVSVKKLITTANEFHEEVEPAPLRTEELTANKANTAMYQHKSDVEALEVALKREQMQLLELLTQASGGRTEDLSYRKEGPAEVVNRSDDSQPSSMTSPRSFVASPRKGSMPFSVPSAVMFEAPKAAAPAIKGVVFGGAVAASPKATIPVAAPIKLATPSPAAAPVIPSASPAKQTAGPVVPSAALFEPPKQSTAVAMKKMPAAPKSGPDVALSGSPTHSTPPASSSAPSGAPAKFNPFAAVKGPVKRSGPVPPPPGQAAAQIGRPVPPPPK